MPHITEEFALTEHDGTARLDYSGEMGTDFGIAGQWWAGRSRPPGRQRSAPPSPLSGPNQNAALDQVLPVHDARYCREWRGYVSLAARLSWGLPD